MAIILRWRYTPQVGAGDVTSLAAIVGPRGNGIASVTLNEGTGVWTVTLTDGTVTTYDDLAAAQEARDAAQAAQGAAETAAGTATTKASEASASATAAAADRAAIQDAFGDDIVSQFDAPPPARPSAIIKRGAIFDLYSPLSISGLWALDVLEADTTAMRRPVERRIVAIADLYHEIFDSFTASGSFIRIPSTPAFGGAYRYTAGAGSIGSYVEKEITVDGAANLIKVGFAKRNTANHISVTINGGTESVNLLPTNGAGEKFIDPYQVSTSITVNQTAVIASLPAGTYTIRLTCSAQKNASAGAGDLFYPQAIIVTGGTAGLPGGAKTHAPSWANGEAVLTSDQRWFEGVTYRATTSGTTSGTSPLDDSGVSWAVTSDTYATLNEAYLTDVSEPWWAIWLALNGNSEEDFGGDIHGGVTLSSTEVFVDGALVTPADYAPIYGNLIEAKQTATLAHTAAPGTPVANAEAVYGCAPGGDFPYRNKITTLFSGTQGTYFPGMLPLYHYSPLAGFVYQTRRCLVQGKQPASPSDYYGQSNPKYGENKSLQMLALIDIGSAKGAAGVPVAGAGGQYHIAASLEMTRDSLNSFADSGALTYWDMNATGIDVSSGGYSGMVVKGYFRASDGLVKKNLAAGDVIEARGTYRVRAFTGSAGAV